MQKFERYITNQPPQTNGRRYAAIIGKNPSKGARSPLLWNAAFNAHGIPATMIALDVRAEMLSDLLESLNEDQYCIGGAVAAPYKELVAKWLDTRVTESALEIGSVNSLYRDENGELIGTNTDGEAALASFIETFGAVGDKKILVLGFGGAGKAVVSYFSRAQERPGQLYVGARTVVNLENYSENTTHLPWSEIEDKISEFDVLINCTPLGGNEMVSYSPISEKSIENLKSDAIIFDIIYQPMKTLLLKYCERRGLKTLNGSKMNFEQAVLAFEYALRGEARTDVTRTSMHQLSLT